MSKRKDTFIALDFELATGVRNSVCSIGIAVFKKGKLVNEYYSLVKPPKNEYHWGNSRVHKIKSKHTKDSPTFKEIYPEVKEILQGCKLMVAHNEGFDRDVLEKVMSHYGLDYSELNLPNPWEDTVTIFQEKGTKSAKLTNLCKEYNIDIKPHNALEDARACGLLYLLR